MLTSCFIVYFSLFNDRTVGFASCYTWTLIGYMAAPNLLVLADLIAPFIPLGMSASLSIVAGGLSLLFPSCWRRPLPNTVEEAENKALVPVKDRYPSFRDLNRTGKLASLAAASPAPSNVYSLPPSFPKNDSRHAQSYTVNHEPDQHHQHNHHHSNDQHFVCEYEVTGHDIEDEAATGRGDGNWRLYEPHLPDFEGNENRTQQRLSSRDHHVFKASRGNIHANGGNNSFVPTSASNGLLVDHVSETNLW